MRWGVRLRLFQGRERAGRDEAYRVRCLSVRILEHRTRDRWKNIVDAIASRINAALPYLASWNIPNTWNGSLLGSADMLTAAPQLRCSAVGRDTRRSKHACPDSLTLGGFHGPNVNILDMSCSLRRSCCCNDFDWRLLLTRQGRYCTECSQCFLTTALLYTLGLERMLSSCVSPSIVPVTYP